MEELLDEVTDGVARDWSITSSRRRRRWPPELEYPPIPAIIGLSIELPAPKDRRP